MLGPKLIGCRSANCSRRTTEPLQNLERKLCSSLVPLPPTLTADEPRPAHTRFAHRGTHFELSNSHSSLPPLQQPVPICTLLDMTTRQRYSEIDSCESGNSRQDDSSSSTTVVSRSNEQAPLPSASPRRREDLRDLLRRNRNARVAYAAQKVQVSGGVAKSSRKERRVKGRGLKRTAAASSSGSTGLVIGTEPLSSSLRDDLLAALPSAAPTGRRRSRSRSRSRSLSRRRRRRASHGGRLRRDALKGQPELCKKQQRADYSSDEDIARPERMSMSNPDE